MNRAPTWIGRVFNFNKQMFPLFPHAFIVFLQFSVVYLVLSKLLHVRYENFETGMHLLGGAVSLVLFVYLFRCFDEVKDYPTDKINFPDRPLVTGVLSLKDIYILQGSVVGLLCLINLFFLNRPSVLVAFAIVLLFTLLASRWFFAEKSIRPSLPLALVTHNPIVYLYQIYILSFYGLSADVILSSVGLFLLSVPMTWTGWELSRKIKGHLQEDTYTTYSKIWGPYVPVVLVLILIVASVICSFVAFLGQGPTWLAYLWILPFIEVLKLFRQAVVFWKDPQKAPPFRKSVENYMFLLILIFGVAYFWI